MLLAQRIGKPSARRDIIRIEGNFARIRPQRTRNQPVAAKSLQIVADADVQCEVVGHADRVLDESRILARIRMRYCTAKILLVDARHFVRVGAQRCQRQPADLRLKGQRIDLDGLEEVFTAEQAREKIARPHPIYVPAKFPRMTPVREAQSFRQAQPVLVGLPWQNAGAA